MSGENEVTTTETSTNSGDEFSKYLSDDYNPTLDGDSAQNTDTQTSDKKEGEGEFDYDKALSEVKTEDTDKNSAEILKQINALGIVGKDGKPINFSDFESFQKQVTGESFSEQEKGLLEQKTKFESDFEAQKKTYEENYSKKLAELEKEKSTYQEYVIENQVMAQALERLKAQEPEIYNNLVSDFQTSFNTYQSQMNNPVIKSLMAEVTQLKQGLEKQSNAEKQKQFESVRDGFKEELKTVQNEMGKKLKELKVPVDWKKLGDVLGADGSGKMTVKQALYATYGDQIRQSLEARQKLLETKTKSATRTNNQFTNKGETKAKSVVPGEIPNEYDDFILKKYA